MEKIDKSGKKTKLIPPDGGYGWVIVFASALNNFVLIPLLQNFGLVFKDTFAELGLSATQGSLIINVNSAFGLLTGLVNGPLLNKYGYRKVSFLAGFLLVIGVVLTSFAKSFLAFLITYGCITSLGFGMTMSSYSLAINTYFKEKKGKAIGIAMTITGLGPIIMPQIINLLIENYPISGVTLILGGILGHSLVAAALLQPVKWHMKRVPIDEDENELLKENGAVGETQNQNGSAEKNNPQENGVERGRKDSTSSKLSINYETEQGAILGLDSNLGGSVISLNSINETVATNRRKISTVSRTKTQWWKSQSTVNLESSVDLFDEKNRKNQLDGIEYSKPRDNTRYTSVYNPEMTEKVETKSFWKRFFLRLAKIFDLNLLKDPIYVNIMIGMSLAVFAELNFSVLTAFILNDFGLTTSQIATFMSCLGIADIIFRFLAPFIGDCLKKPPRMMYMFTLSALIATRFGLLFSNDYYYLLGVSVALGIAKGVRTVYMSLVIPTYVPLERLAAASGIQMMVNGVFILIGGPFLGWVRDLTGSYSLCIVLMNCVTFSTIIMWSTEYIYFYFKDKSEEEKIETVEVTTTK